MLEPKMKMIAMHFSKGEPLIVSEFQANAILQSQNKVIQIDDDITGEWTGNTVNKSFLIKTEVKKVVTVKQYYLGKIKPQDTNDYKQLVKQKYEQSRQRLIGTASHKRRIGEVQTGVTAVQ